MVWLSRKKKGIKSDQYFITFTLNVTDYIKQVSSKSGQNEKISFKENEYFKKHT